MDKDCSCEVQGEMAIQNRDQFMSHEGTDVRVSPGQVCLFLSTGVNVREKVVELIEIWRNRVCTPVEFLPSGASRQAGGSLLSKEAYYHVEGRSRT